MYGDAALYKGPLNLDSPLPDLGQHRFVHARTTSPGFDDLACEPTNGSQLARSFLDGIHSFKPVRIPSKHKALNHFSGGNAFVKMSAALVRVDVLNLHGRVIKTLLQGAEVDFVGSAYAP